TWTRSGTTPTSRSRATPRCSRRCASACSTRCRPAPGPSSARSAPRASPAPATTATRSGTPRRSRWRHSTIDLARERAQTLGLQGAAFPWRTIRGQECSAYWPAGTAGFHIGADIADAVRRYVQATGDVDFEREFGLELLVETARLWRSLGHHDRHGRFHIDGVTGPDEYTAVVDDNIYTNLMAQLNMMTAADAAKRHPD